MNQRPVIALQTYGGMSFGSVLRVRSDAITFEVEGTILEQATIEFRMELSGHSDTVMGTLRVLRIRERPDQPLRCSSRVLDMPARDRVRLTAWLKDRESGGTTRRYDNDVSVITNAASKSSATLTETRAALERMDRRGWYRNQTAPTADMLGLNSEVKSSSTRHSGRAALRSALRRSIDRKRQRASEPNATERLRDDTTEAIPLSDPEISRIPHTDPTRIHVRYHNADVYRQEHHKHIRCSAMFLPMPALGSDGTQLQVSIEPPNRDAVLCRAEVKVQMPSGVGVALRLSSDQRQALEP